MPKTSLLSLALMLAACAGPSAEGGSPSPAAALRTDDPPAGAAPGAPATARVALERAFPALTFTMPVDLQPFPGGGGRLAVVEQAGVIKAFAADGAAATTFLDIHAKVASGGEMGLLGLAFHPKFAENGHFYVNYNVEGPRRTIIARFTAKGDRAVADPASETPILAFEQPYSNHKGGQLAFGPDGHLYVAVGDGGSGGDPHGNGQSTKTLLGKLLRLDVDHPSAGRAYGIPADNPFAGATDGRRPEIFCHGLRNPWRFSFDPATGRIWCGDVGQNKFEEVDVLEKGKNYGWNVMEASACFKTPNCDQTGLVLPVAEYGRDLGVSITGGHVYRGERVPGLVGDYVYADFGSGRFWAMKADGTRTPTRVIAETEINPSSFGLDAAGELHVLDHTGGGVYRFSPR